MNIQYAFASRLGTTHPQNEGRVCIHHVPTLGLWLVAVADGMGGHARGDLASTIAVETTERNVGELLEVPADLLGFLEGCVHDANELVREAGQRIGSMTGTTLTVGILFQDTLSTAHVGDSRTYCASPGQIAQLTDDHTWGSEQMSKGSMTEREIASSPYQGLIMRFVGSVGTPVVGLHEYVIEPGATYLFSTDGLHGCVDDSKIHRSVRRGGDPDQVCARLLRLAEDAGGTDDVSVAVLQVF